MKHSLAVYLCLSLQGRGSLVSVVHLQRQRREQVVLIPQVSEAEETLATCFKPISNCHQPYQQQKGLVGTKNSFKRVSFCSEQTWMYSTDAAEQTKARLFPNDKLIYVQIRVFFCLSVTQVLQGRRQLSELTLSYITPLWSVSSSQVQGAWIIDASTGSWQGHTSRTCCMNQLQRVQ